MRKLNRNHKNATKGTTYFLSQNFICFCDCCCSFRVVALKNISFFEDQAPKKKLCAKSGMANTWIEILRANKRSWIADPQRTKHIIVNGVNTHRSNYIHTYMWSWILHSACVFMYSVCCICSVIRSKTPGQHDKVNVERQNKTRQHFKNTNLIGKILGTRRFATHSYSAVLCAFNVQYDFNL